MSDSCFISRKTYIFVVHLLPISVVEQMKMVFYFFFGVNNVLSLLLET